MRSRSRLARPERAPPRTSRGPAFRQRPDHPNIPKLDAETIARTQDCACRQSLAQLCGRGERSDTKKVSRIWLVRWTAKPSRASRAKEQDRGELVRPHDRLVVIPARATIPTNRITTSAMTTRMAGISRTTRRSHCSARAFAASTRAGGARKLDVLALVAVEKAGGVRLPQHGDVGRLPDRTRQRRMRRRTGTPDRTLARSLVGRLRRGHQRLPFSCVQRSGLVRTFP